MTSSEEKKHSSIPRDALLRSLQQGSDKFLTEEKLNAIFDVEMQKELVRLLDFYQTTSASTTSVEIKVPDLKFKGAVTKLAQFTFLSTKTLEQNVIEPFFSLNHRNELNNLTTEVSNGNGNEEEYEKVFRLIEFYFNERLATIRLISWLLTPSTALSQASLAVCKGFLTNLLSQGLLENICKQLLNLSSITIPNCIVKENRNELCFMWIHQNILEQKELSLLLFHLFNSDFSKISLDLRSRLLHDLIRDNFGLNNFEKYNLDFNTVLIAQEAFWLRQAVSIRILDLNGMINASVSSKQILSNLCPIKLVDLEKIRLAFKTELTHQLTSPFKFSWCLLVGFMDSLDLLEDKDQLKFEYTKVGTQCADLGVFKILYEIIDNFTNSSKIDKNVVSSIKSLVKDIYISFFTIFDLERSSSQILTLTEGLVRIFSGEARLCEEFWFIDSQYPGRTSILKYWINRFPLDFIPLIRLLNALSSGSSCSQIVSDLLFKGFDQIWMERSSDRGAVSEQYDLSTEVYNLTVTSPTELHSCGLGFILESGTRGVMSGGFNDRPMVAWKVKIPPFHFLLRILQISQDFTVNFYILNLFETFLTNLSSTSDDNNQSEFPFKLFQHLQGIVPIFSQSKTHNLPATLIDLLIFILDQPNPNALIMSKCLHCLVAFEDSLDSEFFSLFMQFYAPIMDGIISILGRCVYNVDIDETTFSILVSVMKFAEFLITMAEVFKSEKGNESSILSKAVNSTIFSFIIEHLGKWRFVSQSQRLLFLSEVCRLVLSIEKCEISASSEDFRFPISNNFAFLTAIVSLLYEICNDNRFDDSQIFEDNSIDVMVFFTCLTRSLTLPVVSQFFGFESLQQPQQSPTDIITKCLSRDYLVLPVLFFYQNLFQNEQFAFNVKISKENLKSLCEFFENIFSPSHSLENRKRLPKVISVSLAVLNNSACTRPDIFSILCSESCIKFFIESVTRCVFDYETELILGIISILWNSVAEFSNFINLIKKEASNFIEIMFKFLTSLTTVDSSKNTAISLKCFASIFEILSVELCYFNPSNSKFNLVFLKSFDPEAFVQNFILSSIEVVSESKNFALFQTFLDAFILFSQSCLSLRDEREFNRKIILSLTHLILSKRVKVEDAVEGEFDTCQRLESVYKVFNYGLLQQQQFINLSEDKNACFNLIGFTLYNSLFQMLFEKFNTVAQNTFSSVIDYSNSNNINLELVTCMTLLLKNTSSFIWTLEQHAQILKGLETCLTALRHFLILQQSTSIRKEIVVYLNFFITSIESLSSNEKKNLSESTSTTGSESSLVHFIRREGALKTIFSLIKKYRDTDSLTIFTSSLLKIDFIAEEVLSFEILESFIEIDEYEYEYDSCNCNCKPSATFVNNEQSCKCSSNHTHHKSLFFLSFLDLLSVLKIQFNSNLMLNERISTILYGCNVENKIKRIISNRIFEATKVPTTTNQPGNSSTESFELLFLRKILSILQLLSCSALDRPIESRATEAFLTSLLESLLKLLSKSISSLEFNDKTINNAVPLEITSLLLCTLGTFNLCARPNNPLKKTLQNLLFPLIQSPHSQFQLQSNSINTSNTSQYASAIFTFLSASSHVKTISTAALTTSIELATVFEFAKQILMSNCPERLEKHLLEALKEIKINL